jgi:hypothetical protein
MKTINFGNYSLQNLSINQYIFDENNKKQHTVY